MSHLQNDESETQIVLELNINKSLFLANINKLSLELIERHLFCSKLTQYALKRRNLVKYMYTVDFERNQNSRAKLTQLRSTT